jgi:predicted MarR family transcription regulator
MGIATASARFGSAQLSRHRESCAHVGGLQARIHIVATDPLRSEEYEQVERVIHALTLTQRSEIGCPAAAINPSPPTPQSPHLVTIAPHVVH